MGRRPTTKIDPAVVPQAINANEDTKARAEVTFENQSLLGPLFGQFDANLVQLENRLGVFIHARGDKILIEGTCIVEHIIHVFHSSHIPAGKVLVKGAGIVKHTAHSCR